MIGLMLILKLELLKIADIQVDKFTDSLLQISCKIRLNLILHDTF